MSITRTCRISGAEFTISDQEIRLLDKLSPVIGGERFQIPLPNICPLEQLRRKLPYKNYSTLFKRTDSETGEPLISGYPPESIYTVYSQPHWWSDSWSPLSYGRPYNPSQAITEQIYHIWKSVPVPALDNAYHALENSDYVNGCGQSKDCYLTSNSAYNEKCLYGWHIFNSTAILNSNYVRFCENCSHSQHIWKCYNTHYAWDASECRDAMYIFSCEGSQYLLGCTGLKNQKYHILNVPCTPEEFRETLSKIEADPIFCKDFEHKVSKLIGENTLKKSITTGSIDSTGDFCYDSEDAHECTNIGDCQSVCYITDSFNTKDSAHISMWGEGTILSYDSIDVGLNASNIYFSTACWEGSKYNFYSHKCNNCQYIFGCSGLRNKSYCIFNIEYTKDEWEKTVKSIIQQMVKEDTWGEFLDPSCSHFAYNESVGALFSPMSREEVLERGFRWSDRPDIFPEGITKTIPAEKLPFDIKNIPDDVLNWAILCRKTGKPYKIQPIELEMHRRFGIPLPHLHPLERIQKLLSWDKRVFDFEF